MEIENEIEEVSFDQSIEEVIEEVNDDAELIVEDDAIIESFEKDNDEINGLIIKTDTNDDDDDDNQINGKQKGIFYLFFELIFIKIYLSAFSLLNNSCCIILFSILI